MRKESEREKEVRVTEKKSDMEGKKGKRIGGRNKDRR